MTFDEALTVAPADVKVDVKAEVREDFWNRLTTLEERHRDARLAHETARRQLESCRGSGDLDLRQSWEAYCEAIASLDAATSELEVFRGARIRAFVR